jgi:hypothetical protein
MLYVEEIHKRRLRSYLLSIYLGPTTSPSPLCHHSTYIPHLSLSLSSLSLALAPRASNRKDSINSMNANKARMQETPRALTTARKPTTARRSTTARMPATVGTPAMHLTVLRCFQPMNCCSIFHNDSEKIFVK